MEELTIKDRILKGAEELFIRYSVRSVTMEEIARHLGISKKTLYQHFADKDDIVSLATEQHINKRCGEFDDIQKKSKDAIQEMVLLSSRMRENMKNANPSMLYDIQKYHPKAWKAWIEYRNKFIRSSMERNLNEGIEQGYYRANINPHIIATIRMEMIQIGFDEQVFPRDEFNTSEVQMQLLDHFTHGILTEKGLKKYNKYQEELEIK